MGNLCCNDYAVQRPILDKLQNDVTIPISNKQYYVHNWPSDDHVQSKISELKKNQEYSALFENHKMMKHKFYDKYYIGEWDQNGYPQGKGVLLVPDSFLYHGDFDRVPNGKGNVELFREKIKYEGGIKDGKAQGQGKITSADGRYTFEGIMKESFPFTGKITIQNGSDQSKSYTINLTQFPSQPSQIIYNDGRKYQGYLNKRSFAPQGAGTAFFADDSNFEGNWQQGQMHGMGTFRWKDGSSYCGEYQHGRKHGVGTFVFRGGKKYEGEWVHGKQHGKGTLSDPNGNIISRGTWKEGVFVKQSDV